MRVSMADGCCKNNAIKPAVTSFNMMPPRIKVLSRSNCCPGNSRTRNGSFDSGHRPKLRLNLISSTDHDQETSRSCCVVCLFGFGRGGQRPIIDYRSLCSGEVDSTV